MSDIITHTESWRKTAPEVKELSGLSLPAVDKMTLPNGITLNIIDRGESEVCRLGVAIRGGLAESRAQCVASLAASLMREGSQSYQEGNLADLFERNGAWIDTSAHSHYTLVHVYSLNNRFCDVLPGVVDMILRPEFSNDIFEIFRENNARALETDLRKVANVAMRESDRIFLGSNHPLGRFDTPDDIRLLSVDEVRDFHSSRCNDASNITLFLTGKIHDDAIDAVSKAFGRIDSADKPCGLNIMLPQGKWTQDVRLVEMESASQCAVKMTIPSIPREHDDYESLRVAVCALGGYFGSRLNTNIREVKGLTYGISSSIIGIDGYGAINIACLCDGRYVDTVITEIRNELHRMASDDFSKDELARLKRFYMTTLSGILESPFSVMDFYESSHIANIPSDYFLQQLRALESLSAESLRDMAVKYFNSDRALTVVAGNKSPFDN